MSARSSIISPQITEPTRPGGHGGYAEIAGPDGPVAARPRPPPLPPRVEAVGLACRDFAASNDRESGKKAKMRCNMPLFCRNDDIVCATQSATTRVS
jgi:hypothetical protein